MSAHPANRPLPTTLGVPWATTATAALASLAARAGLTLDQGRAAVRVLVAKEQRRRHRALIPRPEPRICPKCEIRALEDDGGGWCHPCRADDERERRRARRTAEAA